MMPKLAEAFLVCRHALFEVPQSGPPIEYAIFRNALFEHMNDLAGRLRDVNSK